jgi:hypothetical protein
MELGRNLSSHPYFKPHSQALQRAFAHLSAEERSQFRQRNLTDFLSTLNKSPFSPNLVRELMKRMEKNETSILDINRIIEVYVGLELEISERIEALREKNDELSQVATEFKRKEMHAVSNPRSAEYNHRTLFVEIKKVNQIASQTGTANAVVEMSFEGQKQSTKVVSGTLNPEFNEHFEFKVTKGTEPLKIEVYDYSNKELKGQVFIPVSGQATDKLNYNPTNLMTSSGNYSDTLIEFSVLISENKQKLYSILFQHFHDQSELSRREIDERNDQLQQLVSPFGLSFESGLINYSREEFKQIDDIVTGRLDNFIKSSLGREVELGKATAIAMCLFAFFSAFVMFSRPDFFSVSAKQVTLAAVSLLLYVMGSPSSMHYKNLATLVAVSEVNDIVWVLFVGLVTST